MNVTKYIIALSEMKIEDRQDFVDHIEIKNYGSNELTETDMWILSNAAENEEYLTAKLEEADELSLDTEAPAESEEELTLDTPAETPTEGGDELSLDAPTDTPTDAPAEGGDELSLDAPAEGGDELSLDTPTDTPTEGGDELSLDTPTDEEPKTEIETSAAGIGILGLLGEIQEKLANGKPSEVELAALKAMKKLVG